MLTVTTHSGESLISILYSVGYTVENLDVVPCGTDKRALRPYLGPVWFVKTGASLTSPSLLERRRVTSQPVAAHRQIVLPPVSVTNANHRKVAGHGQCLHLEIRGQVFATSRCHHDGASDNTTTLRVTACPEPSTADATVTQSTKLADACATISWCRPTHRRHLILCGIPNSRSKRMKPR